ncbi:histamine H2 receptor-like [Littorina saxatilis]|uniref:histamine H2 receptor-like n=1 Tax=Littorina saxatilis TaxID=31220 RepID=UPI0038B5E76E
MSGLCSLESNITTNSTEIIFLHKVATSNFIFAVTQILFIPFIVAGNVLVIASICVFRRLQNLTNGFLVSLAVSDLIVAFITIPLYAAFYLNPTVLLCDRSACLAWFGSVILGCGTSLFNLLVIVLDRFLAIHFPFSFVKYRTPRNVAVVLVILWLYVMILSFLPLMGWNHWETGKPCNFYATLPKAYVILSAYLTVGVCTTASCALYTKIFMMVCEHKRKIHAQNAAGGTENKWLEREVKSTRLMATVFLLFVLFWLPYFCVGPLKYSSLSQEVVEIIKNATLVLAFGNSMVNPFVYCLLRKKFRAAFRLLVTTPVHRWSDLTRNILVRED